VDRSLPPAEIAKDPVSDAVGTDPDGNEVGVLLWTDGGYLHSVEVYYYDEPATGTPRPEDLRLCDWVEVAPGSFRLRWEV
jgi:hypothetical protein